jgi:hypothetical protein
MTRGVGAFCHPLACLVFETEMRRSVVFYLSFTHSHSMQKIIIIIIMKGITHIVIIIDCWGSAKFKKKFYFPLFRLILCVCFLVCMLLRWNT